MRASLAAAFRVVVGAEGEYSNDPRDPGGPTKYGVSWRAVRLRDKDRDGHLDFDLDHDGDVDEWDIRALELADAERLFLEDYWTPCRCDELPAGIDLAVVDSAYNQGPRTAVALLQRAVGAKEDGIPGLATITAVRAAPATTTLRDYLLRRLDRYRRAPSARCTREGHGHYLGWANRIFDHIEPAGLRLIAGRLS